MNRLAKLARPLVHHVKPHRLQDTLLGTLVKKKTENNKLSPQQHARVRCAGRGRRSGPDRGGRGRERIISQCKRDLALLLHHHFPEWREEVVKELPHQGIPNTSEFYSSSATPTEFFQRATSNQEQQSPPFSFVHDTPYHTTPHHASTRALSS